MNTKSPPEDVGVGLGEEENRTTLRGPNPVERWSWTIFAIVLILGVAGVLIFLYR